MQEYFLLLRSLFKELGPYRIRFGILGVIGALDAAVGFAIPWSISQLIDEHTSAWPLFMVVLTLFLISLGLQFLLRRFAEALGPEVSFYLRSTLLNRASKVSLTTIQQLHTGYLLSLTTSLAESTGTLVTSSLWGLVRVITVLILFFASLIAASPLVALVNAIFLLVFVITSRRLAAPVTVLSKALNHSRAQALAVFADFMGQLRTLFRLRIFSFAEQKIKLESAGAVVAVKNFQQFHAQRWFLLHSLYGGAFLSTLGLLLWGIQNHGVAPAMLILFVGAFAQIRGNLEWMAENFVTIKNFLQISADLDEAFSTDSNQRPRLMKHEWEEIILSQVTFQYSETSPKISVPSLTIKRGDWWIVKGNSGEGKTTLLHLLCGLYEPQAGAMCVDGDPKRMVDSSLTSQESELFSLSLRENLTLGNAKISDQRILDLFEKTGLSPWFYELPDGLDTVVGERGQFLSAGQRQRLNLIRGIFLDRDLYLLDEPISHLDEKNQILLMQCIEHELHHKTVVIVSHQDLKVSRRLQRARFENHILTREHSE